MVHESHVPRTALNAAQCKTINFLEFFDHIFNSIVLLWCINFGNASGLWLIPKWPNMLARSSTDRPMVSAMTFFFIFWIFAHKNIQSLLTAQERRRELREPKGINMSLCSSLSIVLTFLKKMSLRVLCGNIWKSHLPTRYLSFHLIIQCTLFLYLRSLYLENFLRFAWVCHAYLTS